MAKLTITERPGPFIKKVDIPLPVGGSAELTLTFKYRTRKELAKFNDDYLAAARKRAEEIVGSPKADAAEGAADAPVPEIKPLDEVTLADAVNASGAQYLLDVADAWDMDVPLTLENAQMVVDMYGGVVPAVAEVYNKVLKEGRLGN